MKTFFKKLAKFLFNIVCRILFIVLSIVLWPIYIATTVVFVPLECFVILFVLPILWVFVGTDNINRISNFLFKKTNKELWHTDYTTDYNKDGSFISFIPIWGIYVQENCLSKLIPEDLSLDRLNCRQDLTFYTITSYENPNSK